MAARRAASPLRWPSVLRPQTGWPCSQNFARPSTGRYPPGRRRPRLSSVRIRGPRTSHGRRRESSAGYPRPFRGRQRGLRRPLRHPATERLPPAHPSQPSGRGRRACPGDPPGRAGVDAHVPGGFDFLSYSNEGGARIAVTHRHLDGPVAGLRHPRRPAPQPGRRLRLPHRLPPVTAPGAWRPGTTTSRGQTV
jgi:hypothetical protein